MAERIVPAPSLTAVATPVDRFVAPVQQHAAEDPLLSLARTLQKVNPAIQGFIDTKYEDYVKTEEAEGVKAESYIDPSVALQKNREGWKALVDQQRKLDQANGTNHADKLAASSPHFQRGLLKSRAKRMGMALNDHLAGVYARNPEVEINGQTVNLHSIDDPAVLQQWAQGEIASYTERYGLNNMDPVLVAEVYAPLAMAAQDSLLGVHVDKRLKQFQQDYLDEMSANTGFMLNGFHNSDSDVDTFIRRLAGRESGGNYNSVNSLGYTGLLQFGQARLDDFNRAHGTSYTLAQFKNDHALQDRVNRWHIEDIDKAIDASGFLDKGWSRDGLRAVAHLGGIKGMERFVREGRDVADAYGTKLSDYYEKFSSPAPDLQEQLDEAIGNGIDKRQANETIVDTVIRQAVAANDPSLLTVLNDISTGSGMLGDIGWVKDKVSAAESHIQSAIVTAERNQRTKEQWAREDAEREIMTQAVETLLNDPFADITPLIDASKASGNPDLAKQLYDWREKLLDDQYKVRTVPEVFTELRHRIGSTTAPDDLNTIQQDILRAANNGLLDKGDVGQLYDDVAQQRRNAGVMRNPFVQDYRTNLARAVKDNASIDMGLYKSGGEQESHRATVMFDIYMRDFVNANENPTESQLMDAAAEFYEKIINMPEFQQIDPFATGDEGDDTASAPAQEIKVSDRMKERMKEDVDLLADMAEQYGMTQAEFITAINLYGN